MRQIFCILFCLIVCGNSPLAAAEKEWQEYKTDNFKIFAHRVDEAFINTAMTDVEEAFTDVLNNLGVLRSQLSTRNKPISLYIYQDEQDYIKNGCQTKWSHGAALVQLRSIRTYPAASGFFDSILPHELGHIVLHEYIGLNTPIPLWFDEGVAIYQEKAKQLAGRFAVKEAIKNGTFIPLTELTNMRLYSGTDLATVALFYAESASVVNFLITQSSDFHFKKLCRELKERRSFHDALRSAYPRFKSIEDLNKKWVQYLNDNE